MGRAATARHGRPGGTLWPVTSNRPGPRSKPLTSEQLRSTPGTSRARQSMEQRSAAPLLFLRQLIFWLYIRLFI